MSKSSHEKQEHLADAVDKLIIRLSSIRPSSSEQLEQWRTSAYRSIDAFCEKKHHELVETRRVHQKKELDHLRHKVNELIENNSDQQGHRHSIQRDIRLAEIKINELEHLRLTTHPLSIDEHLVSRRHLFPLPAPTRTILLKTGLESAVGTNERHLLVDREGKHLCLLDRHLSVVREVPFTHDGIHSVFWSSTIARFVLITFKEILLLDEKTMHLDKCPVTTELDWWRGTCSDDILFLSAAEWGSSIYEFSLRSSFKAAKQWHAPTTCSKDEIICDIKFNNGFLAVPIFNKQKTESRLELRSATTLECVWSVRAHGRCRCCSIDVDQWLLMDHDDCRFFHISADGKLLETGKYDQHEQLEDIIPWGKDDIVVLTKKNINLHKLS